MTKTSVASLDSQVKVAGSTRAAVMETVAKALTALDFARSTQVTTRVLNTSCVAADAKALEANRQLSRLWAAATLPEGWDGYDAQTPDADAIRAAEAMILRLANSYVPVPTASVGAEGQSNLHWSGEDFYADVDIFEDRTHFFIVSGGKQIAGEEEIGEAVVPPKLFVALMDRFRGALR